MEYNPVFFAYAIVGTNTIRWVFELWFTSWFHKHWPWRLTPVRFSSRKWFSKSEQTGFYGACTSEGIGIALGNFPPPLHCSPSKSTREGWGTSRAGRMQQKEEIVQTGYSPSLVASIKTTESSALNLFTSTSLRKISSYSSWWILCDNFHFLHHINSSPSSAEDHFLSFVPVFDQITQFILC